MNKNMIKQLEKEIIKKGKNLNKSNFLFILSFTFILFFTGCEKEPKCFKEVVAFDKIANSEVLKSKYIDFTKKGAQIESKIEYAEYMSSLIKPHIFTKDVDKIVKSKINGDSSDFKIKYTIIENDKEDPKKKSKKCKLFAGYLLFEFYNKEKMFYKVQIDFMDTKGADIEKRVSCIFKMLEYHYKKL
jgi:hypothetical protein